jgi:hypothetical protein
LFEHELISLVQRITAAQSTADSLEKELAEREKTNASLAPLRQEVTRMRDSLKDTKAGTPLSVINWFGGSRNHQSDGVLDRGSLPPTAEQRTMFQRMGRAMDSIEQRLVEIRRRLSR